MVYRFGLEALARAVSHQLNALLVWHIRDREVGTQLSNCVHLRPSYRWRMSVGIESISGSRFESDSNPAETTTWMIHPEESARGNDPVGSMEGVGHALFHGPTIHLHGLSVFTTKFEALALQKA